MHNNKHNKTKKGSFIFEELILNTIDDEEQSRYSCMISPGKATQSLNVNFFVSPSFNWEFKKWLKKELAELPCKGIVINASHLTPSKYMVSELLRELHGVENIKLSLSDSCGRLLNDQDPKWYSEIKALFLTEDSFNHGKLKEKEQHSKFNMTTSQRMLEVATKMDITSLQRRIYLYVFSKQIKSQHAGNDVAMLARDYKLISKEFASSLKVEEKEVVKALDALKKKGYIQVVSNDYDKKLKFFLVTGSGPVDSVYTLRE